MIFLRAPLSDDIIIKSKSPFPCPRPIDLPEQDVETAASGIEASNKGWTSEVRSRQQGLDSVFLAQARHLFT